MITREQLTAVGHYNKPHGVGGELSATLSVPLDGLDKFSCLITEIDGIAVPFYIDSWRAKTAGTALLKIDGIDSEHAAAMLVGKDIFALKQEWQDVMQQEADEDPDLLPADFLRGFIVVCNGEELGEVTDVDCSTANVLLQVATHADGKTVILPAADGLIKHIDVEARTIAMNVPEALLHING